MICLAQICFCFLPMHYISLHRFDILLFVYITFIIMAVLCDITEASAEERWRQDRHPSPPRLLCCRAPRPRHHYLPIHDYSVLRLRCHTQTHHHVVAPLRATGVVYPTLSRCSTLPPLSSPMPCRRMPLPSLVHTCFPAHAPVRSPILHPRTCAVVVA